MILETGEREGHPAVRVEVTLFADERGRTLHVSGCGLSSFYRPWTIRVEPPMQEEPDLELEGYAN